MSLAAVTLFSLKVAWSGKTLIRQLDLLYIYRYTSVYIWMYQLNYLNWVRGESLIY